MWAINTVQMKEQIDIEYRQNEKYEGIKVLENIYR